MPRRILSVTAAQMAKPVGKRVPPEILDQLAADPDIGDWLISVSEHEEVRELYLFLAGKFLHWAEWTPQKMFAIKKQAMREGEPVSQVEARIRQYHEALKLAGYAGKYRATGIAVIRSLLDSKGYTLKRRLVRLDTSPKLEMRVPETNEVDTFIQYARGLHKKLLYTMLKDTPCRPRVFPALRWNWLEENWWEKKVVYVTLPREFRPSTQSGSRKFEPACFFGPRTIELLKQHRQAIIRTGHLPLEADSILGITYDALLATINRDYTHLVQLGLIRPSRIDKESELLEQPILPKSWRKYQFNIIDSLPYIAPEWRKMLKGRDLQTEKYYSKQNVDALRKIYQEQIYPRLWPDTHTDGPVDVWATFLQAAEKDPEGLRKFLRFAKGLTFNEK